MASDKIKTFEILIDDASMIFAEFDTFGYAVKPEEHIDAIVASNQAIANRTVQVGDRPVIGYFGGKSVIFEVTTDIAKVSALHVVSSGSPAPNTIHIEGPVHVRLDLKEPCALPPAIDHLLTVLRFLDVIAGRHKTF